MSVVQDSLTKKFKQLSEDQNSKWYCKLCIKESFVFGKSGKIAFIDIINITSMTMILILLAQSVTKNAKKGQFRVLHVRN